MCVNNIQPFNVKPHGAFALSSIDILSYESTAENAVSSLLCPEIIVTQKVGHCELFCGEALKAFRVPQEISVLLFRNDCNTKNTRLRSGYPGADGNIHKALSLFTGFAYAKGFLW